MNLPILSNHDKAWVVRSYHSSCNINMHYTLKIGSKTAHGQELHSDMVIFDYKAYQRRMQNPVELLRWSF